MVSNPGIEKNRNSIVACRYEFEATFPKLDEDKG